ncbi:MAG: hypothetical protein KF773_31460 [Deltaproteobacteria bacterium]|nr:hypothetical protein [Deltaproteobacteria bacterium]
MAYRKAKVDAFYEYSIPTARDFALYEQQLASHLNSLLAVLVNGKISAFLSEALGEPMILPKRLTLQAIQGVEQREHRYFSEPQVAFKQLLRADDLVPEFRTAIRARVDAYVLTALWINLIGHRFEARLESCVYASRMKRKARDFNGYRSYNLQALGTYEAYADPYKRWRNDGFRTLRREIEAKNSVIALSLDIDSYYHNIDPTFLSHADFLRTIGLELDDFEIAFTKRLVNALKAWARRAVDMQQSYTSEDGVVQDRPIGGLPIGLPVVRLLANILLYAFDRDVMMHLAPLYYGRYVDDIFLVLKNPDGIENIDTLLEYLDTRLPTVVSEANVSSGKGKAKARYRINLGDYQGESRLRLQPKKQKAFFLSGDAGLDLIETIEAQVREVSSERRLMPNTERLEKTASARVLAASNSSVEQADILAKADGLAIRRLSWSVQLRSVETLERDLPAAEWKPFRSRFYRFAKDHVLRPERMLDHLDYLPRLLGVAAAGGDWEDVDDLVDVTQFAISEISNAHKSDAVLCGIRVVLADSQKDALWAKVLDYVLRLSAEAILRALYCYDLVVPADLPEELIRVLTRLGVATASSAVATQVRHLQFADLGRVPYKQLVQRSRYERRARTEEEIVLYSEYRYRDDLEDFLRRAQPPLYLESDSLLPFICSTRPFSPEEIALLVTECVLLPPQLATYTWKRFVRACRGVPSTELGHSPDAVPPTGGSSGVGTPIGVTAPLPIPIGRQKRPAVKIGLSSLLTSEATWRRCGLGRPDESLERYQRIGRIVDEAIRSRPRPDYLLLPELSLPRRWIRTISERLQEARIDLIAGLEYIGDRRVHSSALLVLRDGRLGYPSTVQMIQDKSRPAPGEEEELLRLFGKTWSEFPSPDDLPRRVYAHNGFCFGVLICSELQNISHRQWFQGKVDALIVLSWNRDLETFSALVESASLDVHAYVALTNNRKYGDSRIRAPAKEAYQRDICRLRGGENDHVVVSELNIVSLREFQSRARPWARDNDPFKPVPDGFEIWPFRRTLPK